VSKELSLLTGSFLLGSALIFSTDSFAQSCEPPADMEPGRVVNNIANLRAFPTMQSALLQVLGSQSEILIGDEQTGLSTTELTIPLTTCF